MNLRLHIERQHVRKLLVAAIVALFKGRACLRINKADVEFARIRLPVFMEFPEEES